MSDETTTRVGETGGENTGERVGFCQDCGKALTRETVKTVGSGVFCEPCLEKRLGTAPQQPTAPPAGYTTGAGYAAGASASGTAYTGGTIPQHAVITGAPKPGLAAVLGLIPGAGACYNGQYAKGMIHLVIWATLMEISDHVGVFCLFVIAWEVYMSLEAYHTAKARRDGLPLPNPFGFNEMGERMGFGKGWSGAPQRPYGPPPTAGPVQTPIYAASENAPGWGPPQGTGAVPPPPPYGAPQGYGAQASYGAPPANWAGYVHPTHFAGPSPVPPYTAPTTQQTAEAMAEQIRAQALRDATVGATTYAETFSGTPGGSAMPPAATGMSRFPVEAIWLIALGGLVLLATLAPGLRISGQWVLTLLFAGLSAWTFTRKLSLMGGMEGLHGGNIARLACIVRGPAILLVLAAMFALQAAHVATLGQSWPLLVIAIGVLLILERTVGSSAAVYGGNWPATPVPPAAGYQPAAAPVSAAPTDDSAKDGQA